LGLGFGLQNSGVGVQKLGFRGRGWTGWDTNIPILEYPIPLSSSLSGCLPLHRVNVKAFGFGVWDLGCGAWGLGLRA
jgi:hypothetical protein